LLLFSKLLTPPLFFSALRILLSPFSVFCWAVFRSAANSFSDFLAATCCCKPPFPAAGLKGLFTLLTAVPVDVGGVAAFLKDDVSNWVAGAKRPPGLLPLVVVVRLDVLNGLESVRL